MGGCFAHSAAMTTKPYAYFSGLPTGARNKNQAAPQQPRASLDGLEVRESCFGQWLEAGGDRRSQSRDDAEPGDSKGR